MINVPLNVNFPLNNVTVMYKACYIQLLLDGKLYIYVLVALCLLRLLNSITRKSYINKYKNKYNSITNYCRVFRISKHLRIDELNNEHYKLGILSYTDIELC